MPITMYFAPPPKPSHVSDGFSASEIHLPIDTLNLAEIELTKQYPRDGSYACNLKSDMLVRIIEGEVRLTFKNPTKDIHQQLVSGWTVLVQKEQPYYWTPKGRVRMLVFSAPAWTPEQHVTL